MVEILFSRVKVPLNVSKNKQFRKNAVTYAEYGSCLLEIMVWNRVRIWVTGWDTALKNSHEYFPRGGLNHLPGQP